MKKLFIETMPISTNSMYSGRRILTQKARTTKEAIAWEIHSQYKGKVLAGPVCLAIDLYFHDHRRRDVDNIKMILDSMTGIVFEDDSQVDDLHIRKHIDAENPRFEIQIL